MFREMREEINERNSTLGFFYDFFVQIDYFLTSEIQMRVTKACNSDFNRFMLFFLSPPLAPFLYTDAFSDLKINEK